MFQFVYSFKYKTKYLLTSNDWTGVARYDWAVGEVLRKQRAVQCGHQHQFEATIFG